MHDSATGDDGHEIIQTEGLTKVFPGAVKAVDHLDLSLRRGEIFGLLGPNGAGKTTTVGMLSSMVVPTEGRAVVGGVDVIAHPALASRPSASSRRRTPSTARSACGRTCTSTAASSG